MVSEEDFRQAQRLLAEAPRSRMKARQRGRQRWFSQTRVYLENYLQRAARFREPAKRRIRMGLQQYVVFQRPGHPVDDEPPVVTQGGEEPGVSRGPVHGIHAVLVLLVGRDDAVLWGLLAPARHQRHA